MLREASGRDQRLVVPLGKGPAHVSACVPARPRPPTVRRKNPDGQVCENPRHAEGIRCRYFSSQRANARSDNVRSGHLDGGLSRGRDFHSSHRGPVRSHSLARVGRLTTLGDGMSALYWVSGLLTLGLFAYLLYALIKPERF